MDLFGKVHQLVDYGLSFHQKAVFLVDFSRGSICSGGKSTSSVDSDTLTTKTDND
jgi:hypothetical protein